MDGSMDRWIDADASVRDDDDDDDDIDDGIDDGIDGIDYTRYAASTRTIERGVDGGGDGSGRCVDCRGS